jgi:hypothetical protein
MVDPGLSIWLTNLDEQGEYPTLTYNVINSPNGASLYQIMFFVLNSKWPNLQWKSTIHFQTIILHIKGHSNSLSIIYHLIIY